MSTPLPPNRGGAIEKWTVRLIVPVIFAALAAAMLSVAGPTIDWRGWFDGPERGTWRALALDGEDVRDARLSVSIVEGEVVAGHDGCNAWWVDGEPDPESGERNYMSTLAACGPEPFDTAYGNLAFGNPSMVLSEDGDRLELSANGHYGLFMRWSRDMAEAEREADERAMEAARRAQQAIPSRTSPAPSQRQPPRAAEVPPAPPPLEPPRPLATD